MAQPRDPARPRPKTPGQRIPTGPKPGALPLVLNPLQRLIVDHIETTGETLADVADRGGVSRQTVSALLHRDAPGGIPRHSTLVGLANGLQLDIETVQRAASHAAAAATGVDYEGATDRVEPRIASLVAAARKLDDDTLKAVAGLARKLAAK